MASKFVRCPRCDRLIDAEEEDPMDGAPFYTPFEVQCPRCEHYFLAEATHARTFYRLTKQKTD